MTDTDLMILNATSDGVTDDVWNTRTQLRARIVDVNAFKYKQLARLGGPEVAYASRDEFNGNITHPIRVAYIRQLLQVCVPPAFSLTPGAVVLSTREIAGVPAGTQGVVLDCRKDLVICS